MAIVREIHTVSLDTTLAYMRTLSGLRFDALLPSIWLLAETFKLHIKYHTFHPLITRWHVFPAI